MKVSSRGSISPFRVMDVMREANEYAAETGKDVIQLTLGQPGSLPPLRMRQRVAELMLSDNPLGYTDAFGILPLRQKISQSYRENYGVDISPDRIAVTIGSSAGIIMALLCVFDHGDKVAIANPCYPAYPNVLHALGLKPLYMRGTRETNFQPTVELLKNLPEKPDGLILASPSNPAGTVLDSDELRAIAKYCDEHNIRIISDEIYHGITYDGVKTESAAACTQHAVVINSFSKLFVMPGWRLGWLVLPKDMVRPIECLLQNFFISAPAISQYAGLAAFDCMDELKETVESYARNRQTMLNAMARVGLTDIAPAEGAFYIYANISRLSNDSAIFCREMLEATGVVAVPGYDFDHEQGSAYVRFSFAGTEASVTEAMKRFEGWLGHRQTNPQKFA